MVTFSSVFFSLDPAEVIDGMKELSDPGGLIQVDHLLRHLIICDNVGGNKASKACSEVTCRFYSMSSVIIKADILGDPVYCS